MSKNLRRSQKCHINDLELLLKSNLRKISTRICYILKQIVFSLFLVIFNEFMVFGPKAHGAHGTLHLLTLFENLYCGLGPI